MKTKNLKHIRRSYLSFTNVVLLLALVIFSTGCGTELEERQYELVWQDEFEGSRGQLPDTTKWVFDIGTDWGNSQLEYDTDRKENCSLDGEGNLRIVAIKESYAGSAYTSARIKTQGKFEQTYGRFEARMKLPYGPGLWPAFWLLGSNIDEDPWPQCGEIDIMEYRGQQPNLIHGTLHGPGYSGGGGISKSFGFVDDRFDVDYHIFAVEWGEDYIQFFVDDNLYLELEPEDLTGEWVYDHPFFIILNLAVGGNYVGFPSSETNFPQTLYVDYVRVYEEVE